MAQEPHPPILAHHLRDPRLANRRPPQRVVCVHPALPNPGIAGWLGDTGSVGVRHNNDDA